MGTVGVAVRRVFRGFAELRGRRTEFANWLAGSIRRRMLGLDGYRAQ